MQRLQLTDPHAGVVEEEFVEKTAVGPHTDLRQDLGDHSTKGSCRGERVEGNFK